MTKQTKDLTKSHASLSFTVSQSDHTKNLTRRISSLHDIENHHTRDLSDTHTSQSITIPRVITHKISQNQTLRIRPARLGGDHTKDHPSQSVTCSTNNPLLNLMANLSGDMVFVTQSDNSIFPSSDVGLSVHVDKSSADPITGSDPTGQRKCFSHQRTPAKLFGFLLNSNTGSERPPYQHSAHHLVPVQWCMLAEKKKCHHGALSLSRNSRRGSKKR